jgi:hypothetical protein
MQLFLLCWGLSGLSGPGVKSDKARQPSTILGQSFILGHDFFPLLETRSNRIFTMQKHPFIKQTRTLIRGLQ